MTRTLIAPSPSQSPSRPSHGVPVHIDVHIPLVLLSSVKVDEQYTTGPDRHENRLQWLYNGLCAALKERSISLVLWDTPSLPEKLVGTETDDERRAIKARRDAWRRSEEQKKESILGRNAWALRATPKRGEDKPVGVQEGWREADGLLTDKEAELAYDSRAWTLQFTLQRYSLELEKRNEWEKEINTVMETLKKISQFSDSSFKRLLSVLASERCHPQVTFHRKLSTNGPEIPWEKNKITNLLLLVTAFERELGTMTTPEYLLRYRPLSNFLTRREVKKMHMEKKRMWKDFWQEIIGDKRTSEEGQLHRQRRWNRKCQKWLDGIIDNDIQAQRQDEFLGEEGQAWWEKIHRTSTEVDVAGLIKDIVQSTTEGRGSQIGFTTATLTSHDDYEATSSDTDEAITCSTSSKDQEAMKHNDRQHSLPLDDPPTDPFPAITSISFPIPFRDVDAAPILSYINLLIHILNYASNNSEDHIISFLDTTKRDQKRAQDTPLEGLTGIAGLALKVGCTEERVRMLKAYVEKYTQEGTGRYQWMHEENVNSDPFWNIERYVRRTYEEGRRAVFMRSEGYGQASEDGLEDDEDLYDGGDIDDAENDKGRGPSVRQIGYQPLLRYLERYEHVKGFLVPSEMKVLSLLEAKDHARHGDEVQDYDSGRVESEDEDDMEIES